MNPSEDSEPRFPNDEEIEQMLETMRGVMGGDLVHLLEEGGVEPSTMLRFSPLAEQFKKAREGKGLSPDEVGRKLGVGPGVVIGMEHAAIGELDPRVVSDYVALLGLEAYFRAWADRFTETAALLESGGLNQGANDASALTDSFKALTPEDHDFIKRLDSMDDKDFVEQLQDITDKLGEDAGPDPEVFQFKITLDGVKPPIWRRIQTPSDFTLAALSGMIQAAMGWEGFHLHAFEIDGTRYGVPMEGDWEEILDEGEYSLDELGLRAKSRFKYEYDFGDDWRHTVVLEKILPWKPEDDPVCVTGKRACPPEDCGGVWGYRRLLEALADPKHPEHKGMKEWLGGEVPDPERFSLERANLRLATLFPQETDEGEETPSARN